MTKLRETLEQHLSQAKHNAPGWDLSTEISILETCLEFLSALEKIECDPPILGKDDREDFAAMVKADVRTVREAIAKAERRMMGDSNGND